MLSSNWHPTASPSSPHPWPVVEDVAFTLEFASWRADLMANLANWP